VSVVLLGCVTAALFGCSDFLGGTASRRDSAFAVTANAHILGVVVFAVACLVFPAVHSSSDLAWGAVAGVSGGLGVACLYAALASGRMSIVAPITASLSGALPAAVDLMRGTRVGPYSIAGIVLALVAIVIVSMNAHPDDRAGMPPRAVVLSLLAGVGFAGGFLAFAMTAPTSGLWPLLAARVTSAVLLGGVTLLRRGGIGVAREARLATYGAGALETLANITMLAAIRSGPLAIASVLGSLYPVMTIFLARVVLGERMRWLQRAGVAVALVAVVLTALR
jgi:drug/metabolite transporter (DMT)-like permease